MGGARQPRSATRPRTAIGYAVKGRRAGQAVVAIGAHRGGQIERDGLTHGDDALLDVSEMNMAPEDPPRAMRGRPSKRDAVLLRERIQGAALAEFRRHGFAGSSIDGIARAASASRTTIYALYTDKETLFTEMIRASITGTDITSRVSFDDRAPQVVLREAMEALNKAYHREPNLELLRLCIGEADRFPILFEQIRDVLAQTLNGLTGYFDRMHRAGAMIVPDSHGAALLFNMLALGSLKPFFVQQGRMTAEEAGGHIDLALAIFLRGCFVDHVTDTAGQ